MLRKRPNLRPVSSLVTTASQICVVRPPCTIVASAATHPFRAVPVWLHFSSIVVKPMAPSGSDPMEP